MNARVPTLARIALALLPAVSAVSCERDPSAPVVSETEIWRLGLEQTDDGGAAEFPRRGTINLLLRLNHTATPDPECAGSETPDATTFVASVEAILSRLQPPATGTATGSWNCFGFAAEVRLNDGTTYALTSAELTFDPARLVEATSPMSPHRWTAGERRGRFLFVPRDRFTYDVFDSHLDVRVQNRHGGTAGIALARIGESQRWSHHDLEYSFVRPDGLAVEVDELGVTVAPDTLSVAAGGAGIATVRLGKVGLLGLDVRLSVPELPPGVLLVPPSFSPGLTRGDSSAVTLRVDGAAQVGSHPLTVCATIVVDPRGACHAAQLVLRVTEPRPPFDLAIFAQASNDTMRVGQEVFFNVLVGSLGGEVAGPIEATSRLPGGFAYLRHQASAGSYLPATGVWTIGTVRAGPPATLRIYAPADSLGTFTHLARLTGGIEGDTNPSNNADSTTVVVTAP